MVSLFMAALVVWLMLALITEEESVEGKENGEDD